MKRIIAISLIAVLGAALLCGCGKEKTSSTVYSSAAQEIETTTIWTPTQDVQPTTDAGFVQMNAQATTVPGAAPQGAQVAPNWFDDAVFVGDSITTTLDYFCADDPQLLGNAQFVCADCLGYHNAQWELTDPNAVHPTYQGQTVLAETAAEITGANKIFILMGINDIDTYGVSDTMDSLRVFVDKIRSHSPNVQFYFQSTTPMITPKETEILNNNKITVFDAMLRTYCEENGFHYLDLYHQMCNEKGALRDDYCDDPNDDGIHFNYKGCIAWADYLKSAVAG